MALFDSNPPPTSIHTTAAIAYDLANAFSARSPRTSSHDFVKPRESVLFSVPCIAKGNGGSRALANCGALWLSTVRILRLRILSRP